MKTDIPVPVETVIERRYELDIRKTLKALGLNVPDDAEISAFIPSAFDLPFLVTVKTVERPEVK